MMTKRELFNAKNNGQKLTAGLRLTVTAVASYLDERLGGEAVEVYVLKTKDGVLYTTISKTIGNGFEELNEIIAEEGSVEVAVTTRKSNAGRDYFILELV